MKKILISITIPDGINPEVIDIGYTTPGGNFESHRVYESEFKQITLPTEKEIENEANKHYEYEYFNDTYFRRGAEWYRNQILNQ